MAQNVKQEEFEHIEIHEKDQAGNIVATYISSGTRHSSKNKKKRVFDSDTLQNRIDVIVPKNTNSYAKSLLDAFLPAGYPHSVTKDYLEKDSLQAFSSSIAGLLSSRAVLEGIGVGDQHASPTAALLLSVLQESMGRVATILFAHRLGTALEPECKMYRLAADIFNDSAMVLDCLSPALPKVARVLFLSLSSVLRSLCGVAAGSSKASLSAHFATKGNLGELNAKDSSQETVISLMGMLVGTVVVSHISSQWATWIAMILLLGIHIGTNYMAVRAVSMRTLNRQRANILFSHYLSQFANVEKVTEQDLKSKVTILTPEQVSLRERIFERDGILRWNGCKALGYCQLGTSFQALLDLFDERDPSTGSYRKLSTSKVKRILALYRSQGYILWYNRKRTTFLIILKDTSNIEDQLRAWMHALYASRYIRQEDDDESLLETFSRTMGHMAQIFDSHGDNDNKKDFFRSLEESGWDVTTGAMETSPGTRVDLPKI
ncbi:hypothetical protein B7463_g172, partial [Scytalidium lignicola]